MIQMEYRNIDELCELERNPRTISKKQFDTLKKSLQDNPDYFEARPIILSNRTGKLVIIAGNQRYKAAKALKMEKVPTVLLEGLTEEREREIIIRDNVANGEWDMDILANEWGTQELGDWGLDFNWEKNQTEYQDFVDKFKPKLTTDDCYTPPEVYAAVEDWVRKQFPKIGGMETIRPFKPEGDYTHENYDGKVVIDNPPFSILSEICKWYEARNIPFFLFGPHLTILGSGKKCERLCHVIVGAHIVYENGAVVPTSFLTNLIESPVFIAGSLLSDIEKSQPKEKADLDQYKRPANCLTSFDLGYIANNYHDLEVKGSEGVIVGNLDELKRQKKGVYGGGMIVNDVIAERAAAERAAAERAAAEKEKIVVGFSERELEILKELNKNSGKG